ncbi:alpha/beta hydrolase [Candidatus Laterigemmans baculatus]|uniref:alpha/beta hydrolase n=1 Tax=Candidatus Laterigemmans baculatus TaxID=2770505 RepID=UPI0013DA3965|nr:alpha/beta hydrolase [Candidatus Laterigemmans baculatus]
MGSVLLVATSRRTWVTGAALGLALLLGIGTPASARASSIRSGDEIWILCTRNLTTDVCAADLHRPNFSVQRYNEAAELVPATADELLATIQSDPTTPNVVYVHGNRFTHSDAIQRAGYVYRRITSRRASPQNIRFIVWSWPSEPIHGLLKDVRTKADRTDSQGLYLAWLLREIAVSPAPLDLLGYSFGGRVVTGALHAVAGGSLDGRRLPGATIRGLRVDVGLIAPAIHREWLLACDYHGLATKNMNRMVLMYNPRDVALRQYWLLDLSDIGLALGAVGPMRFGTRHDGSPLPVRAVNCSRAVGREHDEIDYMSDDCGGSWLMAHLIDTP